MNLFRLKALSLFYRELSTLLAGGMPVVQAMGELAEHVRGRALRNAVGDIKVNLEQGMTVGAAFARYPQFFPEWHVGVMEAGEQTGKLADALKMIADHLERNYADILKLAVGLAYPAFLLAVALAALPLMRLGTCGGRAGGIYGGIALAIAGCAGGYFAALRVPGLGRGLQAVMLAVPLLGGLIRKIAVTRFIRALQALTASGVPILTGWKTAAAASGNEIVRGGLLDAMKMLETGGTLSDALSRAGILPAYMIGMISSGEKSGSIVKMLDSAAAFCEKENEAAIGVLLKVVPVAVYLAVAAFVGLAVISSYNGYFNSIMAVQ